MRHVLQLDDRGHAMEVILVGLAAFLVGAVVGGEYVWQKYVRRK